jgi:hypothetical protein
VLDTSAASGQRACTGLMEESAKARANGEGLTARNAALAAVAISHGDIVWHHPSGADEQRVNALHALRAWRFSGACVIESGGETDHSPGFVFSILTPPRRCIKYGGVFLSCHSPASEQRASTIISLSPSRPSFVEMREPTFVC